VSVKYSATPKTTAAINHTTHGVKAASKSKRLARSWLAGVPMPYDLLPAKSRIRCRPVGVLVVEVNLHPHDSLAEGEGLQNLVPHALHEIGDGVDVLIRVRQDLHRS
jgi:hypothetical protein